MLVVEGYGALDGGVGEGVTVGEVFGYDARAWLVFLGEVGGVVGFIVGCGRGAEVGEICGGGDGHLRRAELGVVKEEGGFGGAGKGW